LGSFECKADFSRVTVYKNHFYTINSVQLIYFYFNVQSIWSESDFFFFAKSQLIGLFLMCKRWWSSRTRHEAACVLPLLQHKCAICYIILMFLLFLSRRYKQPKEYPQELPKSPIRPPSVEEYRSTPTPEYTLRSTIIMPHEHLDEIREERVHLSQVLNYFLSTIFINQKT